jgi:hypothetical protein
VTEGTVEFLRAKPPMQGGERTFPYVAVKN